MKKKIGDLHEMCVSQATVLCVAESVGDAVAQQYVYEKGSIFELNRSKIIEAEEAGRKRKRDQEFDARESRERGREQDRSQGAISASPARNLGTLPATVVPVTGVVPRDTAPAPGQSLHRMGRQVFQTHGSPIRLLPVANIIRQGHERRRPEK